MEYKEIPCRRCGRVWKWSADKTSTPHCPEGYGCSTVVDLDILLEVFQEDLENCLRDRQRGHISTQRENRGLREILTSVVKRGGKMGPMQLEAVKRYLEDS